MSVTRDITASWRSPASVIRRHLDAGPREDRALVFLMLGCALALVANMPRLARRDALEAGSQYDVGLGAAVLGWLFIMPLFLYGLAALSHVMARIFGGQGSWFGARLSLFWALLASSPLWLLSGLTDGYLGSTAPFARIVSFAAFALFVFIWIGGLIEAEKGGEPS